MSKSPTNNPNEEATQAPKKRGRPKKLTPSNKPNEESSQRAFFAANVNGNNQPSQRPTNANVNENDQKKPSQAPKSNASKNENEQSKRPSQKPNDKKRFFRELDDQDNEDDESQQQEEKEKKKQKLSAKKEEILKTKRVFKSWEGIFNSAQKGCKGMTNFRDSCLLRMDQVESELKDNKVKDDDYKFNRAVEKAGLPSMFYFSHLFQFLLHLCCIFDV